jgi:hypothetical protein
MADTGQVSGWHKLARQLQNLRQFNRSLLHRYVVERHSYVDDNCRTDMADAALQWVIITQM